MTVLRGIAPMPSAIVIVLPITPLSPQTLTSRSFLPPTQFTVVIILVQQAKESTMTTTTVETSSTDSPFTMTVAATDDVAVAVVVEASQEQQTLPPQGQQEEATTNSVGKCNLCCTWQLIFYLIFLGGCVLLMIA
jgi:hypothetical protein